MFVATCDLFLQLQGYIWAIRAYFKKYSIGKSSVSMSHGDSLALLPYPSEIEYAT